MVRTQLMAYTHTSLNLHNGDDPMTPVVPNRLMIHRGPSRWSPDLEFALVVLSTRNTMLRPQCSVDADAAQAQQDCTQHHMERPTTVHSLITGHSKHTSTCSPPHRSCVIKYTGHSLTWLFSSLSTPPYYIHVRWLPRLTDRSPFAPGNQQSALVTMTYTCSVM